MAHSSARHQVRGSVMRRRGISLAAGAVFGLGGPAVAQPTTWDKLPRMELERQFAGPLQDTVIQRWRDPMDGTICYIYLPISAPHSQQTQSGFVQYGATTIGSISCHPGAAPPASTRPPRKRDRDRILPPPRRHDKAHSAASAADSAKARISTGRPARAAMTWPGGTAVQFSGSRSSGSETTTTSSPASR